MAVIKKVVPRRTPGDDQQFSIEDLKFLKKPDQLVEISISETEHETISGCFTDYDKIAKSIEPYDGKNNICFTLNEINPAIIDVDRLNKLEKCAEKTITDQDIIAYNYIKIDVEPNRDAGISATQLEKNEALFLASTICSDLKRYHFLNMALANTGNGYDILIPTDIPNTTENIDLIKYFKEVLCLKYSNEDVRVDDRNYNPASTCRLYRTVTCYSGAQTEERKFRRSRLINRDEITDYVTTDQLRKYIEKNANVTTPNHLVKETSNSRDSFDSDASIVNNNLVLNNEGVVAGDLVNSYAVDNWITSEEKLDETAVKEISKKTGGKDGSGKQSYVITELVNGYEFFHDGTENGYAVVPVKTHREVLQIRSTKYKQHLQKCYYQKKRSSPSKDALHEAIEISEMKALFDGLKKEVEQRIAMTKDKKIYYDLVNEHYQSVKVTKNSCEIIEQQEVYFLRTQNMKAQVLPNVSIETSMLIGVIRKHFRIKDESDVILFTVWLVTCFFQDMPHAILALFGEKGSAKSTSMRMINKIVDPAQQDVMVMPKKINDLSIMLNNRYMSCFDNIESLSAEQSNLLCMAATGGTYLERTLYSNGDETMRNLMSCIVLNGINVVITKEDLLDRAILIELKRIPTNQRLTEEKIWADFDTDLPMIMGAIFNTLSRAITIRETVELDEVGRMADFSYWGFAIAEALGVTGQAFLDAYLKNQLNANEEALASNPTASAVMALMKQTKSWTSSVTRLFQELERIASREHINTRQQVWPGDASALSKRLKEVKSNLEVVGIYYDTRPGGDYKKITISNENAKDTDRIVIIDPRIKEVIDPFVVLGIDDPGERRLDPELLNQTVTLDDQLE